MVRIQYASKLFINKRAPSVNISSILKPSAPILALLGDIGSPFCDNTRNFIKYCTKSWDMVLWVPGVEEWATDTNNHTMKDVPDAMRSISNKRLVVMNNNSWLWTKDKNEVLFLGTTLWGPCRIENTKELFYKNILELNRLKYKPVDEKYIHYMEPYQINTANKQAINWLNYQIDDSRDEDKTRPIVVLSYNAPSFNSLSNTDKYDIARLPMRNMIDGLIKKPIHTWLYGDVIKNVSTTFDNGIYLSTNSAVCKNGYGNQWTTEVHKTDKSWYPPEKTSTLLSVAPNIALPFD
jgi:hypothetical protein